jgi:uncharacterized membrane protein YhiD involved in acid resistance
MAALRAALVAALLLAAAPPALAQDPISTTAATQQAELDTTAPPERWLQVEQLKHALIRLPLAAGLAAVLALRPRRSGTPKRQPSVIQTQIILAVVGAVVMLVVGTSLARAFGIVGAAGLVRYRAKVDDPKDAGVMLSTLAIGLASGVGVWMLAVFATAFVLVVLWIVESFEKARQTFMLTVKTKEPAALKPHIEEMLERNRLEFELRAASDEELAYEVKLPMEKKTDRLSAALMRLGPEGSVAVEWEPKKDKK